MWENKPTTEYYLTNHQKEKKKKKTDVRRQLRNVLVFLKESLETRRHRYKSICEVGIKQHSHIVGFKNVNSNTLTLTSAYSPVMWNKNHEVGSHRILKNII